MRALTTEELRNRKPTRATFLAAPRNPFSVVLDNLTSGFNTGAIFRTSDAFLAQCIYLCGTTPTPPRAAITKTSMGTDRWVPWEHHTDPAALVTTLRERGTHIVAVELADVGVPPQEAEMRFPLAFILGDEMLGIRPEVLALADSAITIPMLGMANSLSVVSAYAIIAHEAATRSSLGLEAGSAGQQIRRLRHRRGWTLRECGQRAGVSYATIANIENGRSQPTPTTLRKLSRALLG